MIYIDKFCHWTCYSRWLWHWRSFVNEFYLSFHLRRRRRGAITTACNVADFIYYPDTCWHLLLPFDSFSLLALSVYVDCRLLFSLICHSFQNNFTCFVLNDIRSRAKLSSFIWTRRICSVALSWRSERRCRRLSQQQRRPSWDSLTHEKICSPFSFSHAISPAVNSCYLPTFWLVWQKFISPRSAAK